MRAISFSLIARPGYNFKGNGEKIMMRFFKISILMLTLAAGVYAQTTPAAQEQIMYLLGEVKMSSPQGQSYGSSISLVKRTLKPAENKIVEQVLSVDARQAAQEYTTVFVVKDGKFTVKDDEKTFEGEGELTGKAWNWTGWKYTVNMLGERKGKVIAEDVLTESGLTVKKSFYSPDGALRVVFSEELKPVSKEMYEILRAKLLPKSVVSSR
jgi:hypothetical protein